jgi:hypothetical protein
VTGAELEPAEALTPELVAWKVANRIARTEFVPTQFRNRPDAVFAAILFGRELGMGPMEAMRAIHVIQGAPTLKPEAMRARVFAAGHRIRTTRYDDDGVSLVGTRRDTGDSETVTWTMADAEGAELLERENWRHYPRAMLLARATSELCRLLFPDVIAGVSYVPDELGDTTPPEDPDPVRFGPDVIDVDDVTLFDPATGEVLAAEPDPLEAPFA